MEMPKIEEYMLFEDDNGEMGVIIKTNYTYENWWKVYKKSNGGQVFGEGDSNYKNINKLFKVTDEDRMQFYALKFMSNGNMNEHTCVYDKSKIEEPVINNYTINITVPSNVNEKELTNQILEQLKTARIISR